MMKSVVIVLTLSAVTMAQVRPSYFPRPGGFSTALTSGSDGASVNVGDRNSAFQPDAPGSDNYLVDTQLNNRYQNQNYPKEKLPFWYINRQHIEQHRNQQVPCAGEGCSPVQTGNRGSFAGPASRPSFAGSAPRPSFAGSGTTN